MADIKTKYASSVTMTVTNLHSLAASATWVAGWSSASVANTTNLYLDYLLSGVLATHASNRQAGTVELWVMAPMVDTPTFFTPASGTIGTEGAVAFTAVEQKNCYGALAAVVAVTATASQTYGIRPISIAALFGGTCPTHWAAFITGNATTTTTAQFAASGSALYYTPVLAQSV